MYRCPKGCFSEDENFTCIHGGATGKSIEPVLAGDVVLELEIDPTAAAWDRIRDRSMLLRAQEARIKRQDAERQRAEEERGKAMRAPLGHGCPVPRRYP